MVKVEFKKLKRPIIWNEESTCYRNNLVFLLPEREFIQILWDICFDKIFMSLNCFHITSYGDSISVFYTVLH